MSGAASWHAAASGGANSRWVMSRGSAGRRAACGERGRLCGRCGPRPWLWRNRRRTHSPDAAAALLPFPLSGPLLRGIARGARDGPPSLTSTIPQDCVRLPQCVSCPYATLWVGGWLYRATKTTRLGGWVPPPPSPNHPWLRSAYARGRVRRRMKANASFGTWTLANTASSGG